MFSLSLMYIDRVEWDARSQAPFHSTRYPQYVPENIIDYRWLPVGGKRDQKRGLVGRSVRFSLMQSDLKIITDE